MYRKLLTTSNPIPFEIRNKQVLFLPMRTPSSVNVPQGRHQVVTRLKSVFFNDKPVTTRNIYDFMKDN